MHVFRYRRSRNGRTHSDAVYTGQFRDPRTGEWQRVKLGVTQRDVALEKLRAIVAEAEREAAGIIAPKILRDSSARSLKDHLVDYIEHH